MTLDQEKLVSAAIRVPRPSGEFQYYLGKDHAEAIQTAWLAHEDGRVPQINQGFWTNKDRYVDRYEARSIAVKARQIESCIDLGVPLLSEEINYDT